MSERESWSNHCEFFLSSLGLAVGLGNVWRFPFVAYENGGGTFMIPYFVMLFCIGIPALFLEISLGQYGRLGASKLFGQMTPIFRGVGFAMMAVRFLLNSYYVVILAWALFYMVVGFNSDLPWQNCDEYWSTKDCLLPQTNCTSDEDAFYGNECVSFREYCDAHEGFHFDENFKCINETDGQETTITKLRNAFSISPAEDYYNGRVLGIYKDEYGTRYTWEDYGSIRWELAGALLSAWIIIFFMLIKGIQSYGKVAYVITLSPYFVLTVLIGYAGTQDGALDGILFFIKPDWSKLVDINIWQKAASQILFSLSVGFGSQLVLSSYNNFKNNTQRDAILIGIMNSLTSVYAGFVVFSILGILAKQSDTNIENVISSGMAMAFVSYPSAVLTMDIPPIWSFLFFFMLINLALSTICAGVQTILAFIMDEVPSWKKRRVIVLLVLCAIFFSMALPMITNGGIYLFKVVDSKCTKSLIYLTLLQIICVTCFYGVDNFFGNLEEMGMRLSKMTKMFWKIFWIFISPIILILITGFQWYESKNIGYENYIFPDSIQVMAMIVELVPIPFIFGFGIWICYKNRHAKAFWKAITSPSTEFYNNPNRPNNENKCSVRQ